MVEENIVVYEALRNTVIQLESGIQTAQSYMFTVYFALIGLGFSHSKHLFFVSFFVLIVFQNMINSNQLAIERISSYLRTFFANRRNDMHWELLNKDADHLGMFWEQSRDVGWYIKTWGASMLSIFSLLLIGVETFQFYGMEVRLELLFALLLCGVTIYINARRPDRAKHRKRINELDESISKFYDKFCNDIENK